MIAHGILVVAGACLVALQAVKFVATLSAIRWLAAHGPDFRRALEASGDHLSEHAYWEILDRTEGRAVVPLGVLEYRVLRFASRTGRLAGRSIRLARTLIFDFTSIGVACMIFLYLASAPMLSGAAGGAVAPLAVASAVLVVAQLIAIYAEACVAYAALGSYGLAFHRGHRYTEIHEAGSYLTEVKTLAGAGIYSVSTGAFIFYFTAAHGGGFAALNASGTTFADSMHDLLTCAYFSLTTFFTADTAEPQTGSARLATVAIVTQAACALILVVTTFSLFVATRQGPAGQATADGAVDAAAEEPTGRDRAVARWQEPAAGPAGTPPLRTASFLAGGVVIGVLVAAILRGRASPLRRPPTR